MDKLPVILLVGGTFAVYVAALVAYLATFLHQGSPAGRAARPLLLAGMLLNLILLLTIWLTWHHFPLVQVGETLMTATLLFFVCYVLVEIRLGQRGLGVFILSVGLVVFAIGALQLDRYDRIPELLGNRRFVVHVIFSIAGYSFLLIAAIASGLYLTLRRQLRAKRLGALYRRLPPLEMLDRMGLHSTALGFAMLTVGIVLGAVGLPREKGASVIVDPKLVATGLVWAMNAAYLYGRRFRAWHRRTAAWVSVAAFAVLLVSIAVVPMLPGVFHEF